jgi:hypothetical protein
MVPSPATPKIADTTIVAQIGSLIPNMKLHTKKPTTPTMLFSKILFKKKRIITARNNKKYSKDQNHWVVDQPVAVVTAFSFKLFVVHFCDYCVCY